MSTNETFPLSDDDKLLIKCIVGLLAIIALIAFVVCSGCIGINTDDIKKGALDAVSPVVVLKGSDQYNKMYPDVITTIPTQLLPPTTSTPVPVKTIAARQVDMYANGERWQKQWFKHVTMLKPNPLSGASPKKPLEFGVVVYDHKFLPSYTWWSDANGQYYREIPRPGNKFLFVFVHEEVFGDPKTNIPNMPVFGESSFIVQVKQNLYYNDTAYNPVNAVLEFDTKGDYYGISRVVAFGYTRIFIGRSARYGTQYGGWIAEEKTDVYVGQGNAVDGYIIYQVPANANDSDTLLVGNFGAMGNAYWRFDINVGN